MDDIRGLRSLLSGDAPMLRALRDLRIEEVDAETCRVSGVGSTARLRLVDGRFWVCDCRTSIVSGGGICIHRRAVERVRAREQNR
jgi:hypothetical protein